MYARRMEDGSEVWTKQVGSLVLNAPALDWPLLLTSGGGAGGADLRGLDPLNGDDLWTFQTDREIYGMPAIFDDRVYVASGDRYLYCVDAATGDEIWRFWTEQWNRGSVAVGHDGTIYTATSGNVGILFAVSPQGDEFWRLELPGLVSNAPIVAGDGTIYLCSSHWTGSYYQSRVHAIRPDGTELWAKLMPDDVRASPMLAPDGTLYVVCRDKYLYAFKDASPETGPPGAPVTPNTIRRVPPP
jgi:outer membrane protein assembly factor BamB